LVVVGGVGGCTGAWVGGGVGGGYSKLERKKGPDLSQGKLVEKDGKGM